MRALQALQPQIKEIQEKYKNDRQRMQQEMMRFYQENKVNPFASCIPLLAQLPVFITLFYTLARAAGGHRLPDGQPAAKCRTGTGRAFLFIPDLTAKATGAELIVLLVLYVGTQLISGMVMAVTADSNQRILMLVLPFIFVPFIIAFPAGLVLYWITTNVWTIGQQYVIQKVIPAPDGYADARGGAAAKPPPPPPKKKKRGASAGMLRHGLARVRRVTRDRLAGGAVRAGARSWSSGSSTSLTSTARSRSSRTTSAIDGLGRGRGRLRPADRPPRPDDRRPAAALLPGGLPRHAASASGWWSTPPATASAAARRSIARADRAAEQAISGERPIEMDPMSAQERRVVHEHLKDRAGVETYSEGDEPHRCVVVAPLRLRVSAGRAALASLGPPRRGEPLETRARAAGARSRASV